VGDEKLGPRRLSLILEGEFARMSGSARINQKLTASLLNPDLKGVKEK
jgi:hypothetical protein